VIVDQYANAQLIVLMQHIKHPGKRDAVIDIVVTELISKNSWFAINPAVTSICQGNYQIYKLFFHLIAENF